MIGNTASVVSRRRRYWFYAQGEAGTMLRVVTAGLTSYSDEEGVDILRLEPGLDAISRNLIEIQRADLVLLNDICTGVLGLPRTPARILRLLAMLGLLRDPDEENLGYEVPMRDHTLSQILNIEDTINASRLPKDGINTDEFAVAVMLHFSGVTSSKRRKGIDFSPDKDSTEYTEARKRLIDAYAMLLSKLFSGGHGEARQEILILVSTFNTRFSMEVLNALILHPHPECRKIWRPKPRILLKEEPLHPVFHKLSDLLEIRNRCAMIPDDGCPAPNSPFSRAMGEEWSYRTIVDRSGVIIGFESHTRNLVTGIVEVTDTSLEPNAIADTAFRAFVGNRMGKKMNVPTRRGLIFTGRKRTGKGKTQWEVLIDGKQRWATKGQLEKLLAFAIAKKYNDESNPGLSYNNPTLRGKPIVKILGAWPSYHHKVGQDVRKVLTAEDQLRTVTNQSRYELIWDKEEIDFSGLAAAVSKEGTAPAYDSIRALLKQAE